MGVGCSSQNISLNTVAFVGIGGIVVPVPGDWGTLEDNHAEKSCGDEDHKEHCDIDCDLLGTGVCDT